MGKLRKKKNDRNKKKRWEEIKNGMKEMIGGKNIFLNCREKRKKQTKLWNIFFFKNSWWKGKKEEENQNERNQVHDKKEWEKEKICISTKNFL